MQSKIYFAEVAEEWDRLRSGFFTAEMRDDAIKRARLTPEMIVADVGTGTGFVLAGLVDKVKHATGFDESPEMLAVAREKFAAFANVDFREATGEALPVDESSFDVVFANMYLHHTPDPAAAIREMVRTLKPGGRLVITDLDSHSQEWMRERMADRWLGFERAAIDVWYRAVGLEQIEIDCAAGTCDCTAPTADEISLSIFVAIGRKGAG